MVLAGNAEKNAVDSVNNPDLLKDATVYVTLEPCAHHGNTPPCCEMLVALPISRVVVAMKDPTPKVAGKGIQHLRDNGITVGVGINRISEIMEFRNVQWRQIGEDLLFSGYF